MGTWGHSRGAEGRGPLQGEGLQGVSGGRQTRTVITAGPATRTTASSVETSEGSPRECRRQPKSPFPTVRLDGVRRRFPASVLLLIRRKIATNYLSAVAHINKYQASHRNQQQRDLHPSTPHIPPSRQPLTCSLLFLLFPFKIILMKLYVHKVCEMLI